MYQLLFCLIGWKMSSAISWITGGGISIIRLPHRCFSCTLVFFLPKLLLTSIIKYLSDHKQYLLQQDFTLPCQVCFHVSHLSPLSLYHLCVFVEREFVSYQPLLPSFETEAGLLRLGCFRSPHKGDWFSRWCEGSQSKNHEYSGHKGELSAFLVLRKEMWALLSLIFGGLAVPCALTAV